MKSHKRVNLIGYLVLSAVFGCAQYQITDNPDKERVGDPKKFKDGDGETFEVDADPREADIKDAITFTGTCGNDNQGTITWDFKDNSTDKGSQIVHYYEKAGSYEVEATCDIPGAESQVKTLTITINDPKDPTRPGQNPNQNCSSKCS